MILTITGVTQEFTKNGAEYQKVAGTTPDGKEVTKSVFDNLKMAWPLLKEGATLEFKMVQKGQFWNVTNIKQASEPWPEETAAVEASEVASKPAPSPKLEPSNEDFFDRTKDRDGMPLSVKLRTFCISYAKDIGVAMLAAGKETSIKTIIGTASLMENWVKTGTYKE